MSDDFYPASQPRVSGHLDVGQGHKIYYEEFGNPAGKPIVYLHGGPGAGHGAYFHQFFDPKAFRIIVYDQRGCGKSEPFLRMQDNSPDILAADNDRLRAHLGIEKWHVCGGSWGSTLALLYAEEYPDRVESLTLRGIFMMRQKELDLLYKFGDAFFPEEFDRMRSYIPEAERGDLIRAYFNRIAAGDFEAMKRWTRFESAACHLIPATEAELESDSENFIKGISTMETHFFANHRFQPDDRILKNIGRIRHIPTHIVQGHYDAVCPRVSAWDLHQAFPEATMEVVMAGHSAKDDEIRKALVRAANRVRDFGSPCLARPTAPPQPKPPAP